MTDIGDRGLDGLRDIATKGLVLVLWAHVPFSLGGGASGADELSRVAGETGASAAQALTAASGLSTRCESLTSEISEFVAKIRAA